MKKIVLTVSTSLLIILILTYGYKIFSKPPELIITSEDITIPYSMGLNQWNGAKYDRESTFITYYKDNEEFIMIPMNQKIDIKFKGRNPNKIIFEEFIQSETDLADGSVNEQVIRELSQSTSNKVDISKKGKLISFVLSRFSAEDIEAKSLRGYRMTCYWGENSCEYAFIIWTSE